MTELMTLRERKKRETRQRLLAAALALFHERGYEATTIDDIVTRADFSRRTFFRHYASKEDVAFGDALRRLAAVQRDLRETSERTDPLGRVCDLLRDQVLAFSVDPVDSAAVQLWFTEPALRRRYAEIVMSWEETVVAFLTGAERVDTVEETVRAEVMAAASCGVAKAALRVSGQGRTAVEAALDAGFALVRQTFG